MQVVDRRTQSGVVLLESLVALLILALGIFALMAIQARTIVDTRITNNRAQAIRQISNLNERIWMNREQAIAGAYDTPAFAAADGTAPQGCALAWNSDENASSLGAKEIAACDVWLWRTNLAQNIAGARAQIMRIVSTNQVRVMVAWPQSEKDAAELHSSLDITPADGSGSLCPANHICHIQFLEI